MEDYLELEDNIEGGKGENGPGETNEGLADSEIKVRPNTIPKDIEEEVGKSKTMLSMKPTNFLDPSILKDNKLLNINSTEVVTPKRTNNQILAEIEKENNILDHEATKIFKQENNYVETFLENEKVEGVKDKRNIIAEELEKGDAHREMEEKSNEGTSVEIGVIITLDNER